MEKNPRENVELAIVSILSAFVYLHVVHPILAAVATIFTFISGGINKKEHPRNRHNPRDRAVYSNASMSCGTTSKRSSTMA